MWVTLLHIRIDGFQEFQEISIVILHVQIDSLVADLEALVDLPLPGCLHPARSISIRPLQSE